MSCAADRPKDRVAEHLTHRNADTQTHGCQSDCWSSDEKQTAVQRGLHVFISSHHSSSPDTVFSSKHESMLMK